MELRFIGHVFEEIQFSLRVSTHEQDITVFDAQDINFSNQILLNNPRIACKFIRANITLLKPHSCRHCSFSEIHIELPWCPSAFHLVVCTETIFLWFMKILVWTFDTKTRVTNLALALTNSIEFLVTTEPRKQIFSHLAVVIWLRLLKALFALCVLLSRAFFACQIKNIVLNWTYVARDGSNQDWNE